MNALFYIGATGLETQQRAVDTIGHNISNLNTPTFKRSTATFSALYASALEAPATPRGVAAHPLRIDHSPGELTPTGDTLDLALRGAGFMALADERGGASLWRGGRLAVNVDGLLATADGRPLAALIAIPADAGDLRIAADGRVSAQLGGAGEEVELGQIDLVVPTDLNVLQAQGEGVYRLPEDAMPMPVHAGQEGAGLFAQGFVETANVELSREMVALMVHQRGYAASARLVQVGDELMALANGLKRT